MNRWKESTKLLLALSSLMVMIGLILYIGYSGHSGSSLQVRIQEITDKKDQAVYARISENNEEQKLEYKQAETGVIGLSDKEFPSPVQGKILRGVGNYDSKGYEADHFHAGHDYLAAEGTMIRATHGGKVLFAGTDPILGQKVTLDCGEGWLVTYGGLDNLRVKVGDEVETQEALGQVGFFPGAEGEKGHPQLHYEVWHGDEVYYD